MLEIFTPHGHKTVILAPPHPLHILGFKSLSFIKRFARQSQESDDCNSKEWLEGILGLSNAGNALTTKECKELLESPLIEIGGRSALVEGHYRFTNGQKRFELTIDRQAIGNAKSK